MKLSKSSFITKALHYPSLSLAAVAISWLATPAFAISSTEFSVVGNTITFNYGDWYQVQNSLTYETLCEGNDAYQVPNGTYTVINLTIQKRFSVIVGDIGGGSTDVFNFPDDGWYQVQSADTFESVCEGVSSCIVEQPGRYIVINHTSGVRTERVVADGMPAYSEFNIVGDTIKQQ